MRPDSGPKRTKHALLAEAAGIMFMMAIKIFSIALRDGRIPRRALGEISRSMLRETMAARRRLEKARGKG